MKTAITGCTGFLGGALMERLLREGREVLALGRDPLRMRETLPAEVCCALFDLDAPEAPEGLGPGDVVIHCAALLGNADAGREAYLRANTESVRVLALAARDAGAACFQFISSVSAHGPIASEEFPLREESPFHPASIYGESKALAERELAGIEGLRIQVLRPPVIYGPGANRHSSASKIFRLMRGDWFLRSAGGRNRFNVVFLDNLLDACLFLLGSPPPGEDSAGARSRGELPPVAETYHVRDAQGPSMRSFQEWIGEEYGKMPHMLPLPFPLLLGLGSLGDLLRARGLRFPLTRETARGFATSGYWSDMTRLESLGWRPPVSAREAVARTARWYMEHEG